MASQGQPSRRVSIGPLVIHNLQPMHKSGSTITTLKVGAASFWTSYMQRSTGHSVMQIGAPLHPVHASLIIASNLGFLFLCTFRFCFSVVADRRCTVVCDAGDHAGRRAAGAASGARRSRDGSASRMRPVAAAQIRRFGTR